jgi:hypothetical protein
MAGFADHPNLPKTVFGMPPSRPQIKDVSVISVSSDIMFWNPLGPLRIPALTRVAD